MLERLAGLKKVLDGREPLLIVSHNHPDPDSLAASAALQALVVEAFGLKATIAYDGFLGRAENRLLHKLLGRDMETMDLVRFEEFPLVAMVDTQPGQGNNNVPPEVFVSIVIDHHPAVVEPQDVPFWDIRDTYGATSTMLTEYLLQAGVAIDEALATALFYGIASETQDLRVEAVQADEDASDALYPLIDKRMLARIERAPIDPPYYRDMHSSIARAVRYGPLAVARAGEVEHPEVVAEVADTMLRLEGVNWSLAMGESGETLYLSLRTWPLAEEDASHLIRQAAQHMGKTGGHGNRAGGQVDLSGLSFKRRRGLTRGIVKRLRAMCPGAEAPAEPLLPKKHSPTDN